MVMKFFACYLLYIFKEKVKDAILQTWLTQCKLTIYRFTTEIEISPDSQIHSLNTLNHQHNKLEHWGTESNIYWL